MSSIIPDTQQFGSLLSTEMEATPDASPVGKPLRLFETKMFPRFISAEILHWLQPTATKEQTYAAAVTDSAPTFGIGAPAPPRFVCFAFGFLV